MAQNKEKNKHLTFEKRIDMYEKLPDYEKGTFEIYEWGEDLGKEKL